MELSEAWKHYANTPDKSHNTEHINAVLSKAREIAKNYKEVEPEDVEYAAVLHDIAREGDYLNGTDDHHVRGIELARPYIQHLPPHRQHAIIDAISNHRSSGNPETTLGKVIADADRLDSVHRSPQRSFDYYRSRGMDADAALRAGYWNLRHRKLSRLAGRAKNFHTNEGRNIYNLQVEALQNNTRTFQEYLKHIPGVDTSMEFKQKVAAFLEKSAVQVSGYNYTKDGKYPDNILNFSDDKQKEVLKALDRGRGYIKDREEREAKLYRAAKRKLGAAVLVKHPLYFRVGKDTEGEWNVAGTKEYKIDSGLLRKSTYTIGDSLNTDTGEGKLYTYDELKALTKDEVNAMLKKNDGDDGQYIEGQVWTHYKVIDGKIMEDKEMSKKAAEDTTSKSESFYERLRADLKGEFEAIGQYQVHIDKAPEGKVKNKLIEIRDEEKHHVKELQELLGKEACAPAGSVTPQPKGEAAKPVTKQLVPGADVGNAADMMQGNLADYVRTRATTAEILKRANKKQLTVKRASTEREIPSRNFREDYRLPSSDPMDRAKLDNYRDVNQGLLDRYNWHPSIKRHLEKEIQFANGQTGILQRQEDAAMRQQELMVQQQELGIKGQEIGLKAQEAGIGQQNKLVDATVKQMGAQAHRDKKEGDALLTSARKGVQLPVLSRPSAAVPQMGAANANIQDGNQQTQGQAAGDPQQGDAQGQQPQDNQQQSQPQGSQQQAVQNPKNKEKNASLLTKADLIASRARSLAKNFGKNLAGRQGELNSLHKEMGEYMGRAETQAQGSFNRAVNEQGAAQVQDKILKTQLAVRKARTDAALGTAGAVVLHDAYSEPKYASEDGYTLSLNTQKGYAADVMHAIKTIKGGKQTDAKAKLIASAAVAGAAAGMAAYGASKLDPALAAHTFDNRSLFEIGKSVGKMLPFIGTIGGGYYAARNYDNRNKMLAGTAVALTSGAMLGKQIAKPDVVAGTTPAMLKSTLPFAGGMYTAAGAFAYGSHQAQQIADAETIDNAMHSSAPVEEVTQIVNTIRERKNFDSRYPALRHLMMPAAAKKLINARYGKPAGTMSGEDMAYYFQSQVDAEYKRLLKQYEALNQRASQATMTELKGKAHDIVTARLYE